MPPRISIVTPSYNQAPFLRETIESVLGQNYPDLEYIIIDGGSTDGSVEIIREYEKHLKFWRSHPDDGQAAAINEGFSHATGDILGWLNSDDYYLPGTLRFVAGQLDPAAPQLLFGNCFHFVEGTARVIGSDVEEKHRSADLGLVDYVIQASAFWTRPLGQAAGPLDAGLKYAFDWDWFIRAKKAAVKFTPVPRYLSAYRLHAAHKSSSGGDKRFTEIREVYTRHQPERIVRLVDLCRENYAGYSRIRRRARKYKFLGPEREDRVLRWLRPALREFRPAEIRDVMNMIAP